MNAIRNASILAVALIAAGSAFAVNGEATYEYAQPIASTTSRAAVVTDLLKARTDGTLLATEADFQRQPTLASTISRDAVRAQARAAAESGLSAATAERYGYDMAETATPAKMKIAALR